MEKIIRPRCPKCGRIQAEWLTEGGFTCPECKTRFDVSSSALVVYPPLTNQILHAISKAIK